MNIVECPRDAMQGISEFIPTDKKIIYINQLLKVGFDTIDFGSFVSPSAIPQLKDTAKVLDGLDLSNTSSKLLAIIANTRGANEACNFQEISFLGFPLSISEEFQKRNTNQTIDHALRNVEDIQNLSIKNNKRLVVYLSMAFGNPYGEYYHPDIVAGVVKKLQEIEVEIIALSDTAGVSNKKDITTLFSTLIPEYLTIEFGAHFHTTQEAWKEKIDAAYKNGCKRFDSTLRGYGGCPMTKDDLVGNMPTENLLTYFGEDLQFNLKEFKDSLALADKIF